MRKSKLTAMAVAILASQLVNVQSGSAQGIFKASVHAVCISTNPAGSLTYQRYGNREIIARCASEHGITNRSGLSLVYDRTADALEVVHGTNDTLVCTPLTFANGIFLSNKNGTKAERLAWVFWETNKVANGTLAATERFAYGPSNQITRFRLEGQLQFAVAANGTNPPAIYKGSLVAGSHSFEDDEDDPPDRSASVDHRD